MLRGSEPFDPLAGTERQAASARYLRVVDPQLREVMASLEKESHPESHPKKRPMEAMSRN